MLYDPCEAIYLNKTVFELENDLLIFYIIAFKILEYILINNINSSTNIWLNTKNIPTNSHRPTYIPIHKLKNISPNILTFPYTHTYLHTIHAYTYKNTTHDKLTKLSFTHETHKHTYKQIQKFTQIHIFTHKYPRTLNSSIVDWINRLN